MESKSNLSILNWALERLSATSKMTWEHIIISKGMWQFYTPLWCMIKARQPSSAARPAHRQNRCDKNCKLLPDKTVRKQRQITFWPSKMLRPDTKLIKPQKPSERAGFMQHREVLWSIPCLSCSVPAQEQAPAFLSEGTKSLQLW